MYLIWVLALVTVISIGQSFANHETLSEVNEDEYSVAKERRYLMYDINRGEGFNLRRDVYMRVANAVRLLREAGENFVLVLPPWGGLYHWDRQETKVPWATYFDIPSMNLFVPVIEFHQFVKETSSNIAQVVYLQHYIEGWGSEYVMKYDKRECSDGQNYYKKEDDKWNGWYFSFNNVRAKEFECVSIQGDSSTLRDLILKEYSSAESIFIDRAETILHQHYGEKNYWAARRSMRYAPHLIEAARLFRKEKLSSFDRQDSTQLPVSWQDETPERGARGGKYVCAHWRRRDFVRAHGKELPSIKGTAEILNGLAKRLQVGSVYLATDATDKEVSELEGLLDAALYRFNDKTLSDGEIAVVDQIICSRALHFVGSHLSTFSFRIHEDREILGFRPETTFNRMCPDGETECEQPAKWKIVY